MQNASKGNGVAMRGEPFQRIQRTDHVPMTRAIPTFLLSLIGSLLLWSCCPEDPFIPTRPPVTFDSSKQAYLRVMIADPDIAPVDVLVDGEGMFSKALGFFEYPDTVYEAQFWPVDTAAQQLAFALPDGTEIASIPVSFPKGSYHTAYLHRQGNQHRIILTSDDPKAIPPLGEVRYRIVNMTVGSPGVDIIFSEESKPDVTINDLAYGDTTELLVQTAAFKTLTVKEGATGRQIISMKDIPLTGGSVITLVLTGRLYPTGDQKFIYFNIFNDSRIDPETNLYGGLPIPFNLVALRFINLIGTADSTMDLTLEDKVFGCAFPDCFRRNFPGQGDAVIHVASLGTEPPISAERGYFFLSTFLYNELPYRVEVHRLDISNTSERQTVLVPKKPFPIEENRRYTVVAFGPFTQGQADAVTLFDRTPTPSMGEANIRFFHGAFGPLQSEKLRLRISGLSGPLMNYGEAPEPQLFFPVTGTASATAEVVNQAGTVVHTQNGIELKAGKTYTFFLSRGPAGNALLLKAISDDVVR